MSWKLNGLSAVDISNFLTAATFGTTVMTGANTTALAAIFLAEAGHGNIVGFLATVGSVSSPGTLAYRVSVQSVTSRGTPSGTPLGGASPVSFTTTGTLAAGSLSGTFANSLAVNAGDLLAINIEYASGAGTSATFNLRSSAVLSSRGMPYATSFASSSWTTSGVGAPAVVPVYADGYVGHGFFSAPTLTNTGTSLTSSSSPYFWGNSFTPNTSLAFIGCDVAIRMPDASGLVATLFETIGGVATAVSTSATLDASKTMNNSQVLVMWVPMPNYTVQPNTLYHLVINNPTSTAYSTWVTMTFPSAAALAAIGGPLAGCSANNATNPTFTELPTQLAPLCPVFDSLTVSASSALLGNSMSGGMSA